MVFLWVVALIVTIVAALTCLGLVYLIVEEGYDPHHGVAWMIGLVLLMAFGVQCMVWIYNAAGWDWS